MKPMLASATDGRNLRFPLLASPKLDGVRCLIIDGVAMSRSLKPIPNRYVQKLFGRKDYNGLDGELIVGLPNAHDAYRATTSGVMSEDGEPNVVFHIFDDFLIEAPYKNRYEEIYYGHEWGARVAPLEHWLVENRDELEDYEVEYLTKGYEGLMLRDPEGPYKQGRSTEKEGWLLKMKRFQDSEAEIVDVVEFMHNDNEAKRNALGQLERSSHKANKRPGNKLGAIVAKDLNTGVVFEIGTGFTDAERVALWTNAKLIGKIVKYRHQPTGVKDKPRFPVYQGFRDKRDM